MYLLDYLLNKLIYELKPIWQNFTGKISIITLAEILQRKKFPQSLSLIFLSSLFSYIYNLVENSVFEQIYSDPQSEPREKRAWTFLNPVSQPILEGAFS